MKGVNLMKSTLNLNSMHNLLNNLENDLESLTPIEPEILHKHNINAYTHKRHMKNMGNTSNQIEPEFDLISLNNEKSSSDSTTTFDNENVCDYEFMDDIFSSVSSKHTDDEYLSDIPSIEYFLEKYCVINSEYKGELVAKLYYAYEQYCQGEDYAPKGRIEFKKYLEKNIGLKL